MVAAEKVEEVINMDAPLASSASDTQSKRLAEKVEKCWRNRITSKRQRTPKKTQRSYSDSRFTKPPGFSDSIRRDERCQF